MNRCSLLFLIVLGLALSLFAQAPAGQAPQQQKKQITDPEEYKVYVAALNEQSPAKKAEMLDAFLKKYPSSVVKEDALELKMVSELQAGRDATGSARQLLQVNPSNMRALIIMSNIFLQTPLSKSDPQFQQKLSEAEQVAQRGLKELPSFNPSNIPPADLQKTKQATEATFLQALGQVALARDQFPAASEQFRKAAEITPDDASVFYRLGDSLIKERPTPKYSQALWSFARAVTIEGPQALPPAGRTQIDAYLRQTYTKFHGSEDGLDQSKDGKPALKQLAKAQPFPPADFKIMSRAEVEAAKPCEPAEMSFEDIAKTLAAGGPRSDECWAKMKGGGLKLTGKVVSVTPAKAPHTIRFALMDETKAKADAFDVELTLATPLTGKLLVGKDAVEFLGIANSFRTDPFALVLVDGKVTVGVEAPEPVKKAPVKKAPVGKKKAPAAKKPA
jgi:tetratricopeptide (TPR) repeat protein